MSKANPKVGDVGTRYQARFEDSDCEPIDLTGGSVQYNFQPEGGTLITVTGTVDADQGNNTGETYYDVLPADGVHDSSGTWYVWATATTAGGSVFTTDTQDFTVDPVGPPTECC